MSFLISLLKTRAQCISSYIHTSYRIPLTFFALFSLSCADVRAHSKYGNICDQEQKYLQEREESVNKAQDAYTHCTLKKHPKIAFCLSGGGCRAFIDSFAFLDAARRTKLLPATTYIAALSGSTWNLGTLLVKQSIWGQNPGFFDDYKQEMQKRFAAGLFEKIDLESVLKKLKEKLKTYKTVEPADIWGAFLADRFGLQQGCTYKIIRNLLDTTNTYPFPIFTAIVKDTFGIIGEYEWFEINPYVSGCHDWNFFRPTQNLGSIFNAGNITELRPEESLGFFLGVFGSPYDLNIGDLFTQLTQMLPESFKLKYVLMTYIKYFIKKYHLAETNFLPSPIANPAYEYPECVYQQESMKLADAGIDFGSPFPPLLARNADIIICCDASADACAAGFPELKMAERYAFMHKYKFPAIKYPEKIADNMFVFKHDEHNNLVDNATPIIICCCNPVPEGTLKMQYSKDEFKKLYTPMYDMVSNNQDAIAQIIIEKSNQEKTSKTNRTHQSQDTIEAYALVTQEQADDHRRYRKNLWKVKK